VSLDGWRGMLGKRDRLWADPYDTARVDAWCWATLKQVADRGSYKDRIWQKVDLTFEAESYWNGHNYGGAWDLDDGYYFDSGLYFDAANSYTLTTGAFSLANDGNALVTNVGFTFTSAAGTGTRTITFHSQNCEWSVSGIVAADVLIVDCGSRTVLVNGANAYSRFALTANHASPWWSEVAPGGEVWTVTGYNAADTVQATYSDGWV
jgi:hypothetical protein